MDVGENTNIGEIFREITTSISTRRKVAILSFYSGEDRRVKKSFQNFYRDGIYSDISLEFSKASAEECFTNPRAKSAKLRWAVKG